MEEGLAEPDIEAAAAAGWRRRSELICQRTRCSTDAPGVTAGRKADPRGVGERERAQRRDRARDEFFVPVPQSASWLDIASMPMVLTAVAIALFAKVLMMYDESKAQEWMERKIQKAPPGTGTVRMLSREEWDEIQEIRPRTPFESKLARSNARIRAGEPMRLDDVKDWAMMCLPMLLHE